MDQLSGFSIALMELPGQNQPNQSMDPILIRSARDRLHEQRTMTEMVQKFSTGLDPGQESAGFRIQFGQDGSFSQKIQFIRVKVPEDLLLDIGGQCLIEILTINFPQCLAVSLDQRLKQPSHACGPTLTAIDQ